MHSRISTRERNKTHRLRKPKELGFYSRNIQGQISVQDDSCLNYYYFPDDQLQWGQRVDLSIGLDRFQDRMDHIDDPCSLRGLLLTVMNKEKQIGKRIKFDILTFRGIIRKLILVAFESPKFVEPLTCHIIMFDNQIFIKEIPTQDKLNEKINIGSFSGYKFETLTTIPKPLSVISREYIENRSNRVVSNGNEYVSVVMTGIDSTRLILGAEVDCVYDFKPSNYSDNDIDGKMGPCTDNISHYAELKCTGQISSERDSFFFTKKLFRTWLQCFIIGIPRIIYGFRDQNYQLLTIEEYNTFDIPNLVRNNSSHYSNSNNQLATQFNESMEWYSFFIEWLMENIPRNNDRIDIYTLTASHDTLQLQQIKQDDSLYNEIWDDPNFLIQDFKEWRKSIKK